MVCTICCGLSLPFVSACFQQSPFECRSVEPLIASLACRRRNQPMPCKYCYARVATSDIFTQSFHESRLLSSAPPCSSLILPGPPWIVLGTKLSFVHSLTAVIVATMRVLNISKSSDVPHDAIDNKPTLVYWKIVGLGHAIRLVLVYADVDFCDARIETGEAGTADYKQTWIKAKPGLPMPFANLPYYLDGNLKMTQSNAILRHLARQHDLYGSDTIKTDWALDELTDLQLDLARYAYAKGADALLAYVTNDLPVRFQQWVEFLGGHEYIGGEAPSVADFKFYEWFVKIESVLDNLRGDATILPSELVGHRERIEKLPKISEYLTSPSFLGSPLNNPHAKWNA